MPRIEEEVVALLQEKSFKITTAESCTGGALAARIVDVAGASMVFEQGFITYSNDAKRQLLDVSKESLENYGAVSPSTAKEMAEGVLKRAAADFSLAVTGIAGPGGGSAQKPVGLVYIACASKAGCQVEKRLFSGDRKEVREATVYAALELLKKCILKQEFSCL